MRLVAISAALGVALASTVFAQTSGQAFRDPVTGRVWTPENVGGGPSDPTRPENRAFNPQGQSVVVQGTTVQTPNVTPLGTVPITAGPAVPIAVIDNATLTAIPSQRWQVVLYLNNNSAVAINPVIECQFTNSGSPVEQVRANLPPIAGGQRVGLTIYGPQTNLFVNRADCRLLSPA
jgi:hypothetical protein